MTDDAHAHDLSPAEQANMQATAAKIAVRGACRNGCGKEDGHRGVCPGSHRRPAGDGAGPVPGVEPLRVGVPSRAPLDDELKALETVMRVLEPLPWASVAWIVSSAAERKGGVLTMGPTP